ncbi:MAG TPA: hypothetical protein VE778_05725 [Candidatus Bathyarchaeia archaeon]|jgi:hypothetical protein|nr:hypothetical protein [Candidatus Bathyarchaeia archaeon]
MHILLDECLPRRLKRELPAHYRMTLSSLSRADSQIAILGDGIGWAMAERMDWPDEDS